MSLVLLDLYYTMTNLQAMDPSACELLYVNSILSLLSMIEDPMFSGKTLSVWYEEDHSRLRNVGSGNSGDDGIESFEWKQETRG
ncbi:hypothetical protein M441DRAFT_151166 [Trichoderma asperellum CBS 433.97]|uniref:Uncharacterized protein n=1 Tax=Trichoderma asperellum (strain ATCC 204424 / CBS 433.97 / NBRC 101777) TaxID=1042311 RepID=A0A2T3YV68_TRIA4|nr:hypothetical protein M441DRAFT_151166 [Trichoderma asperellum CBS 433.97]PTB36463.1 hypothetical protein M441DRAFT_151166 [Trichoderma asperellum CBS 433.97]